MFSFLKKQSGNHPIKRLEEFKSNQFDFLILADCAYLMTFKQMDMAHFAKYASRQLYMKVYTTLSLERPWAGVSDKFKKTKWSLVESCDDSSFKASKEVVFDKVNVSKQLKISVADDYKELWHVFKKPTGDFVVESIIQL